MLCNLHDDAGEPPYLHCSIKIMLCSSHIHIRCGDINLVCLGSISSIFRKSQRSRKKIPSHPPRAPLGRFLQFMCPRRFFGLSSEILGAGQIVTAFVTPRHTVCPVVCVRVLRSGSAVRPTKHGSPDRSDPHFLLRIPEQKSRARGSGPTLQGTQLAFCAPAETLQEHN